MQTCTRTTIQTLTLAALTTAGFSLPGVVNAADAPKTGWETSAAAGATVTRGNSKTLLFTGQLLSQRKWAQNEAQVGLDGAYGENDSVKSTEFGRIFGQYNRLFNDRFYGYGRAEIAHDAVADVEYRLTIGPGVGYYFIKQDRQSLKGEIGAAYVREKLGGGITHDFISLRVAERYDLKVNDKTRVWQSAEWLPQVDDLNNYILNIEVGIETELTKKLSFRTYIQDSYDNEPAAGRLKNDLKLVAGVGYKF